jgi:hypothetical protein
MKEKQFEPVAASPIPYLTWVVGISSLVLFGCSSLRHALFQSTALDLAFFDQLVYLVSQGLPPISSLFGFHLLGDHAAFILYPIALLYKIYPDVHWLFAVQALALAVGAIPIYALSLQSGLSAAYGRAIALSYLLYPALFNINFYTDFRPEAIAPPALLWAIWAGIANRTGQFVIAVALVLSCKDILSLNPSLIIIWAAIIFLALAKYDYFVTRYLSGLSNINSVRAAVDLVQPQERVLSTTHIGPHLSHRPILKIINKNLDIEQTNSNTFDCIIVDLQHPGRGISPELMTNWLERLKKAPELKLSYQQDGVICLQEIV